MRAFPLPALHHTSAAAARALPAAALCAAAARDGFSWG